MHPFERRCQNVSHPEYADGVAQQTRAPLFNAVGDRPALVHRNEHQHARLAAGLLHQLDGAGRDCLAAVPCLIQGNATIGIGVDVVTERVLVTLERLYVIDVHVLAALAGRNHGAVIQFPDSKTVKALLARRRLVLFPL